MIKKLLNVVVLVLALNFIGLIGGTAFVWKSGHVDKDKLKAIREVLYPPDSQPATTTSTTEPTTEPVSRLDELLAKASGRPASEQIAFIRETFVGQNAEIERQRRELGDQRHQIELAREQLTADRNKLELDRKALADQQQQQTKLANDQGFQDSLALYENMAPKQVKAIFMSLSEQTMTDYIHAMDPGKASKIFKEFKSPEELERLQKVLERVRESPPAPTTAPSPASPDAPAGGGG